MWLRTKETLINLDNVERFEFSGRNRDNEVNVYADFLSDDSHCVTVCICQPDEVQPLLDAIADALVNERKVFSVQEWLNDYRTTTERTRRYPPHGFTHNQRF